MPQPHSHIRLRDDEGGELYAIWSRSAKRLIVTVERRGSQAQVELKIDQSMELVRFLSEQD